MSKILERLEKIAGIFGLSEEESTEPPAMVRVWVSEESKEIIKTLPEYLKDTKESALFSQGQDSVNAFGENYKLLSPPDHYQDSETGEQMIYIEYSCATNTRRR